MPKLSAQFDERAILGLVRPTRREKFLREFKGLVGAAYNARPSIDQDRPGWKGALLLGMAAMEFENYGATEAIDTDAMIAAVHYWDANTPG